eukprot:CCRYP_007042-RA/>CCRYP_007042-RA protein AED:0.32 eAED:0.32 QI:0/0/0/1/0/0.33/3/0/993
MPHPSLTKINGEPTHVAMKKLEKELAANLIAVHCPWGHGRGYLGELLPAALFQARYGAAYMPPAASPPAYPVIPPGATVAAREELRATNDEAQQHWQTMLHVRRIAVNLAAAAIDDVYYAEFDDPVEGLNSVEIQDIVNHIKDRYYHIDQADLDKNLERFNQGIDPSAPLIVYIRKQEDCQELANDDNVNISEATMVTTGMKHAIQCGAFTDDWKEWNHIPCANQTWLAWKTHWTRAFEEQKTIQRLTGGEFSANLSIQATDDELASQMVTSLDNLAFAAVQKNKTVEKLIEMNAQKDKTIAALTSNLTAEKATSSKLLDIISRAGLKGTQSNSTTHSKVSSKWDPTGYCWTHGYRITKGHTSATCKNAGVHRTDNNLTTTYCNFVTSVQRTPGCSNPNNLTTTALLDTGANISLLQDGAPAHKASTQTSAKTVTQPNGTLLTTETLLLLLNKLPANAQTAHRSTGISNNLLAASELVDAGCEIFFHSTGCEVTHNGEIILRGWRDPTTRLWRISLIPDGDHTIFPPYSTVDDLYKTPGNIQALSAYQPIYECTNTNQLIYFHHATMGYPVISTWCKAIDKGYFRGWNGLTSDRVRKFIRPSTASEQGHMDQCRAYLRSTKQSPNTSSTPTDHMIEQPQAPNNNKTNMVYMSTIEVDGQLFTDQTGRFPVTSNRGNNYIVIFYAVDPNFIKSYPIKSRHRSELLKAHAEVHQFFQTRGHRPQLHRLDNETSKDVENFITENNSTFQYTPPDMHRTNIAERAICTWKNHFVAIRAGTPRTYRLSNWCKDLEQTNITLNMLHPCTTNPLLSAYEAVEGMFSFDRTPMAPIGTKVMVHIKPNQRQTCGYHAIRAWYFAPARHHYRCIQVVTEADRITKATQHLICTIDGHPGAPDDELQAIQNLRDLLTGATTSLNDTPPTTIPISTIHEETTTSLAPTLPNLVSPDPSPLPTPSHISPQPLQSAPPTRVPNHPTVIPFDAHEYTPSTHPKPRYNL